jgi:hypothetical protein
MTGERVWRAKVPLVRISLHFTARFARRALVR